MRELIGTIKQEINEKFGITEKLQNHISIIILYNLLLLAPEHYGAIVDKLKDKAILNYYTSFVKWANSRAKELGTSKSFEGLYLRKLEQFIHNIGSGTTESLDSKVSQGMSMD